MRSIVILSFFCLSFKINDVVPKENLVRVFIYHKNKPEDDVYWGDVGLAAEVVAEFYPYINEYLLYI